MIAGQQLTSPVGGSSTTSTTTDDWPIRKPAAATHRQQLRALGTWLRRVHSDHPANAGQTCPARPSPRECYARLRARHGVNGNVRRPVTTC